MRHWSPIPTREWLRQWIHAASEVICLIWKLFSCVCNLVCKMRMLRLRSVFLYLRILSSPANSIAQSPSRDVLDFRAEDVGSNVAPTNFLLFEQSVANAVLFWTSLRSGSFLLFLSLVSAVSVFLQAALLTCTVVGVCCKLFDDVFHVIDHRVRERPQMATNTEYTAYIYENPNLRNKGSFERLLQNQRTRLEEIHEANHYVWALIWIMTEWPSYIKYTHGIQVCVVSCCVEYMWESWYVRCCTMATTHMLCGYSNYDSSYGSLSHFF